MKRILFMGILILCLLLGTMGNAEKGQLLTFKAHILGENEDVPSETIYAIHEINWLVVCNPAYLKDNLNAFEELDTWVFAEDALIIVVPSMDNDNEVELDTTIDDLSVPLSVLVLSKEAKINADGPVTCFVDKNGRLLMNEAAGDPFAEEMIRCYQDLKETMGESDTAASTKENQPESPTETAPEMNDPESVPETKNNAQSITGRTVHDAPFDSASAFASSYVNAFAVCDAGTFENTLEQLVDIDTFCAQQLRGSNFFIFVKNGDPSVLRDSAMSFIRDAAIVLVDDGPAISTLVAPALYIADWDGTVLTEPMNIEEIEAFCYKYSDLIAQKSADALNGLKGRKFMPLQVTDMNGEKKSTDEIFSQNKLTVVNIWETTCNPCLAEMKDLSKLNASLLERGARVVGFLADQATDEDKSVDELIGESQKLMSEENADYDNYVTGADIMKQVPFSGTPLTLFIDQEGRIVAAPVFGAYMDQVEKTVDSLL